MRLVACPSCAQLVRSIESRCPHCSAVRETVTAPSPAMMLLGLALVGCPADDYREDLPQDTNSETSATMSSTMNASTTSVETTDSTGTSTTESTSFSDEAAYGVPETESFTETSTGTSGTGTSGTGTSGTDSTGTDGTTGTDSSTTG